MDNLSLQVAKTLKSEAEKKIKDYVDSLCGQKILGFTIRKFYRKNKKGKVLRIKADRRIDKKLHQVSLSTEMTPQQIEERINQYILNNNLH